MEITEFERSYYLDLAWFPSDTLFAEHELRPLALASYKVMQLMGLTLLDEDAELSVKEETQQIGAYVWIHSAPLREISLALWDGSWQATLNQMKDPLPAVVEEFRVIRCRQIVMIESAGIEILPRPKSKEDDTPARVEGPSHFAHTLTVVSRATGMSLNHVAWELPLAQALQIYHAEMRWNGQWTARPGKDVTVQEFEDFTIQAIDNPAET